MAKNVIMPHMGVTTVEGTVVQWLKSEGDEVRQGEPLVEIVTDKIATEIEAPIDGIVLKIVARKGQVVPVTETLCWLGQHGEMVPGNGQPRQEEAPTTTPTASRPHTSSAATGETYVRASPIAKRLARERGIDLAEVVGTGPGGRVTEHDLLLFLERRAEAPTPSAAEVVAADGDVNASPLAVNLARGLGVDLASLKGSGPRGRILREDVLAVAQQPESVNGASIPTPAAPTPPSGDAAIPAASRVPLVGLRRTIAQRMAQSAQTVAGVTLTIEADVTELVRMREQILEEFEKRHGVRLSYNDLILKVLARALRQHPSMNARLVGEEIHLLDRVNVGVAVAVPEGLVVPVIADADRKELVAIARERREKVDRARAGKLAHEDILGGTFTVTNLGEYEVDAFTPIVNLPEVGILGVGRIVEKPAIFQGEFARRSMMFLSLTFDHRAIDGVPAAAFLRDVKHALEKPYSLLI